MGFLGGAAFRPKLARCAGDRRSPPTASGLETGSRSELCSSIKHTWSPHDHALFAKPGENLVAAKSPNNGAVPPPGVDATATWRIGE